MRVLIVGSGGVGTAAVRTAARWNLFERVVVADYDLDRARRAVAEAGDRFSAVRVDARDASSVAELMRAERVDAVLNAVDPVFCDADIQSGARRRGHLPRHGHVAVAPAS